MTYEKTVWQDRLDTGNKYNIVTNADGTKTINYVGEVIQEGTPLNADNFNKIENGIETAQNTADNAVQAAADAVTGIQIGGVAQTKTDGVVNLPAYPVTGVKGNSESNYRTGNVNITAANIGLGNVGNFKSVSTVADQSLSDTEKADARANIGVDALINEVKEHLPAIYGAEWDGSSTTAWVRTDDAVGLGDPIPYVAGATSYGSPFDNIMPWAGMTKVERTGGTMVQIPKFYYKLTQLENNGMKIQIANEPVSGFHVSPAHMVRGDGFGEREKAYIGRYHCGATNYKSVSGVKPKVSITRNTARQEIHNIGKDIWQSDFAMRFTIWLLYIVEFANWNSQAKIGYGCGNNSAAENMGYTDAMPYHTGTTQSARTSYGGTQYRNIEGLWDNVFDWCDGCYNNSNGLNIILNPNNFSDSSGGTSVGTPSNGWPSKFSVKNASGAYPMFIPTEASGNGNTYSCDFWDFYTGLPCVFVGGNYNQNGNHGLFFVSCATASNSYGSVGSRLMELPTQTTADALSDNALTQNLTALFKGLPFVYGAQWNGSSSTAWTRTDDAADFADPIPYAAGAVNYRSPFDFIMPWAGMTKVERTGGTMVQIPKFYYKLTQLENNGMKIQISNIPLAGYSVSPAHMDRGDGKGERDFVYIGRYHCAASDYKSKSGEKPKVNITRSAARSAIHNLGTNIWQADFATRFTIWLLYIVEFANWNSQAVIGKGCSETSASSSAVFNMGYTDTMPYHTGTTQSARTSYGGTQYRNIEGLWDNCYDWTDGCYNNSNGLNIILNPNNFSDSSGGTSVGTPSSGWPSKFSVKNASGAYPMFIPTEASGSENTYSCDDWSFNTGCPCVYVGGNYYQSGNHGLFFVYFTTASFSYGGIGSRLLELP